MTFTTRGSLSAASSTAIYSTTCDDARRRRRRCVGKTTPTRIRGWCCSLIKENGYVTSDGIEISAIERMNKGNNVALILLHGSYHAKWCYLEHFFDYFYENAVDGRNVDVFAMDFRGQGESGMKKDGGNVAGTLERHAEDVREYAKYIRERKKYEKVLVVGHSFGGLIAQKVFAEDDDSDDDERIKEAKLFDGMILLASVPPTGNSEMVKRFLKKDLWKSMKITYAFISKQFGADPKSCRECFFSEEVEEKDIEKYMRLINDSSKARLLDLKKLNEELPIVDKSKGRQKGKEKVLVIGGKDDYVVDEEGVRETAEFWHVEAKLIEGIAHDVMLDAKWQTVAERMMQFVNSSS
ncbi:unnamed protein product [Bathycoccus prasinos]|jgi:alpha-beta hydrolase superfamily lysophospholipase|tara:strand:- start:88 stop:1143 length:1056 start_codon:yes stop_codon:yes gene_type:complete